MERAAKMIYLITYFTVGAIAAIFTHGMTVAYFWHEYPSLQKESERFSELKWRGYANAILVFVAPVAIIASFIVFEPAKHGLMFKKPK